MKRHHSRPKENRSNTPCRLPTTCIEIAGKTYETSARTLEQLPDRDLGAVRPVKSPRRIRQPVPLQVLERGLDAAPLVVANRPSIPSEKTNRAAPRPPAFHLATGTIPPSQARWQI